MQCQRYRAAVGNRPADIQIKEFLQADWCNSNFGTQGHTAVRHLILGAVGIGHAVIVAGSQPIQLQLAVVVCGSAPDIERHFLVQQGFTFILHRGEQTRQLIKGIGEMLALQRQMAVCLLNGDFTAGGSIAPHSQGFLVTVVCVFQQNFIKAHVVAFRAAG